MKNIVFLGVICLFIGFKPLAPSINNGRVFYYYVTAYCSCSDDPTGLDHSSKKFHKYFSSIKRGETVNGKFDAFKESEEETKFKNYIIAIYSHCSWDRTVIYAQLYDYYTSYDEATDARLAEIASFKRNYPKWEIHH